MGWEQHSWPGPNWPVEGHLSIPSLIGNVLERTSPYTLVRNTVRGLGGHLWFLGETGSSWSSSLGLIALILKGHTSENKNRNTERAHGPAPGIQLVLRSTLNFLYCLPVTKENCHDFVF